MRQVSCKILHAGQKYTPNSLPHSVGLTQLPVGTCNRSVPHKRAADTGPQGVLYFKALQGLWKCMLQAKSCCFCAAHSATCCETGDAATPLRPLPPKPSSPNAAHVQHDARTPAEKDDRIMSRNRFSKPALQVTDLKAR